MKPFKGTHDPLCGACSEESCFGCEIARKALDPDYESEDEKEDSEDE